MNNLHVETIEYKGFNIEVSYDDMCESPREWGSPFTMAAKCDYRMDGEDIDDPINYMYRQLDLTCDQIDRIERKYGHGYELLNALLDKFSETHLWLNLYMYEHGNVAFSTNSFSCRWDSGQIGWIYISKEDARKEWGWDKITKSRLNEIHKWMEIEVEEYSNFANGNVYYYNIEDFNGDPIDSCGGFYGYDFEANGLLEYAHNAIDCYIEDHVTEQEEEHLMEIAL